MPNYAVANGRILFFIIHAFRRHESLIQNFKNRSDYKLFLTFIVDCRSDSFDAAKPKRNAEALLDVVSHVDDISPRTCYLASEVKGIFIIDPENHSKQFSWNVIRFCYVIDYRWKMQFAPINPPSLTDSKSRSSSPASKAKSTPAILLASFAPSH